MFFSIDREWTPADFPASNLAVAALVEGPLAGPAAARMVVVADGNFAVNGVGQQAQRLEPDNVSLLVNSIDWLSESSEGLCGSESNPRATLRAHLEEGVTELTMDGVVGDAKVLDLEASLETPLDE